MRIVVSHGEILQSQSAMDNCDDSDTEYSDAESGEDYNDADDIDDDYYNNDQVRSKEKTPLSCYIVVYSNYYHPLSKLLPLDLLGRIKKAKHVKKLPFHIFVCLKYPDILSNFIYFCHNNSQLHSANASLGAIRRKSGLY